MERWNGRFLAVWLGLAGLAGGCATGPQVDSVVSPEAEFDRYQTFTFRQPLGTDRQEGAGTILSQTLRQATRTELESRGYRHVPGDADLEVNFFVETREVIDGVRNSPNVSIGYGVYHRHFGVWTDYGSDVRQYTEGTLHVDVVDTETDQLAWEGVARGRRSREDLTIDTERVQQALARMFSQFPRAGRLAAP